MSGIMSTPLVYDILVPDSKVVPTILVVLDLHHLSILESDKIPLLQKNWLPWNHVILQVCVILCRPSFGGMAALDTVGSPYRVH